MRSVKASNVTEGPIAERNQIFRWRSWAITVTAFLILFSLLSHFSLSLLPQIDSMATSGKPDRLFVGNLAPSVDEYTLVQVFSKYGKITKLDLMVHNSGPQKGKPRGYAFVEYESKDVSG